MANMYMRLLLSARSSATTTMICFTPSAHLETDDNPGTSVVAGMRWRTCSPDLQQVYAFHGQALAGNPQQGQQSAGL